MYRIGSDTPRHPAAMVVQTSHLVAAHLQSELMEGAKTYLVESETNLTTP
jgi:hypothetical protein